MDTADHFTGNGFDVMGTLLLADQNPDSSNPSAKQWFERDLEYVVGLSEKDFGDFLAQAQTQRVLRRTLEVLKVHLSPEAHPQTARQIEMALSEEQKRVETATQFLHAIVSRFQLCGHSITVMKTLDHWPDTGSDLDLLVMAPEGAVCQIFEGEFSAERQPPSWGDRLASKFSFRLPGLAELVEVHVGCLGQTGEQKALAKAILDRKITETVGPYSFPVPRPEDRIVIATLQRMYRHFYIRLTDIVNILGLLEHHRVNFDDLGEIAEVGTIWPGVATLLTIAVQHGVRYGGAPVELPESVKAAARFNSGQTRLSRNFVRVPIMPEGANLFLRQLAGKVRKYDFSAMMRLSLLPVLATAAFVSFRISGNDKGVW